MPTAYWPTAYSHSGDKPTRGTPMQHSFIFDLNKCTGCQACQVACVIENELAPQRPWREIHTFNETRYPGIPLFHLSLACNHCLDAPCMKYCPALAYSRDPETGAVIIDQISCIGCKYCSWVCPYDAPKFNYTAGVMEKCTFCNHRLQEGREPACVALCPTGALQIGEYAESGNAGAIAGFPETGIRPAIRFIPLREGTQAPKCSAAPAGEAPAGLLGPGNFPPSPKASAAKIRLKSEWTLAAFTLVAAALAGMTGAKLLSGVSLNPIAFLAAGMAGMGLSTLHLGKKFRAWRAILNWRNSWLSREVIFFSVFMGLAALYLLIWPGSKLTGGLAALAGAAALFSMDKVYRVIPQPRPASSWHSAGVLLTGFCLAGLFSGNALLFGLAGLVKLGLYARRKIRFQKQGRPVRPMLSLLRVGLGFALPGLAGLETSTGAFGYAVAGVLAGEIIDRCEYYLELEVVTPRRQMGADMEKRLGAMAQEREAV